MREIKFRAWNVETQRYDPCFCCLNEGEGLIIGILDDNDHQQLIEDGDVVLEQYTGLKDKNGQEIYEGDVIEDTPPWGGRYVSVVTWEECEDGGDYYQGFQVPHHGEHCEVIGNIHDNPELLKQ